MAAPLAAVFGGWESMLPNLWDFDHLYSAKEIHSFAVTPDLAPHSRLTS